MINGIGNFADTLDPKRVYEGVCLRHEDHFDGLISALTGHAIIGQIILDVAALSQPMNGLSSGRNHAISAKIHPHEK